MARILVKAFPLRRLDNIRFAVLFAFLAVVRTPRYYSESQS